MSYEDEVKARHSQRAKLRKFLGYVAGLTDDEIQLGVARIADLLKAPTDDSPSQSPTAARRECLVYIAAILVACRVLRMQGNMRRSRWATIRLRTMSLGFDDNLDWLFWGADITAPKDYVEQSPEAMQELLRDLM